jgi:hypothetical protein
MRIAMDEGWTLSGAGFVLTRLRLPVDVSDALARAGVIRLSDVGLDGLGCEWIYRRVWTLENAVALEQFTQERAILSLPSLKGCGEIWIDGQRAGVFDGPVQMEVTASIARARVRIALVFAPQEGAGYRPFGLGGGAEIRGASFLQIDSWSVQAGDRALRTFLRVNVHSPGTYTFRYAMEQGGEPLGAQTFVSTLPAVPASLEHLLEADALEGAVRWRAGQTNEPITVRLLILRRGEACDAATARTGLRRIDRANPAPQLPACFTGIDGRAAALYGACYAPEGGVEEDGAAVVQRAREAGMTAIYVLSQANPAFYEACDAAGMLVFQELPADAERAGRMARALGAYPCIVQWCAAPPVGSGAPSPVPALLSILNGLADERPFAGVAPSGDAPGGMDAPGRGGVVHALGPEYPLGAENAARYFDGDAAPYRTILLPALAREAEMRRAAGGYPYWPPCVDGCGRGPLWTYRGGVFPPVERVQLREELGEDCWEDVRVLSALTRFWQAECVRYALEAARFREAFGLFALRLGGKKTYLSDDALIAPSGAARPSYHAFAHAMRPVHVCARLDRTGYWADTRFEAFVRLLCDTPRTQDARIEAALYQSDGTALQKETFSCSLQTGEYGCIRAQLPEEPGALTLRLVLRAGDETLDASDQTICVGLLGPLWPLAHLPRTLLRVDGGYVKNVGAFTAHGLSAPGIEWRALLPGERVSFVGDREEIECMNALIEEGAP